MLLYTPRSEKKLKEIIGLLLVIALFILGGAERAAAECSVNPCPVVIHLDGGRVLVGRAGAHDPQAKLPTQPEGSAVLEPLYLRPGDVAAVDWEGMEQLVRHAIVDVMHLEPTQQPVILILPAGLGEGHRRAFQELLFSLLKVPAAFITDEASMALYASGRTSGVVVIQSHYTTQVVPVLEGQPLRNKITAIPLGALGLERYLVSLVNKQHGEVMSWPGDMTTARELLSSLGFVALEPKQELEQEESAHARNFELPNGQVIAISRARFQAPEALFQPSLAGVRGDGLSKLVQRAIQGAGQERELYLNIVLSGEGIALPNIASRLQSELVATLPEGMHLKAILPPRATTLAWSGGSMLGNLPTLTSSLVKNTTAGAPAAHGKNAAPKAQEHAEPAEGEGEEEEEE